MNPPSKEDSETTSQDSMGHGARSASPTRNRRTVAILVAIIVALTVTVGVLAGLLAKVQREKSNCIRNSIPIGAAWTTNEPIEEVLQEVPTEDAPEEVLVPAPADVESEEFPAPAPASLPLFSGGEAKVALVLYAQDYGLEIGPGYQTQAFEWVTNNTVPMSKQRLAQRYALACFYLATNGVANQWSPQEDTRKWLADISWMVDEDECTWYGVTCSVSFDQEMEFTTTATVRGASKPGDKVVTAIQLASNQLSGSLPPELVLLQGLQTLDLFRNSITHDHEEDDWLGQMTSLKSLFYGQTNFVSNQGVPSSISKLTKLEEYDCSYAKFKGPLAGETFAALSNLNYATMSGNSFGSSVPTELVSLPDLEFLYLQDTMLTGDLSFISHMANSKMVEFWMDNNPGVSGSIPSEIGLISTLQSLSFVNCSLTGTLPSELSNVRMKQMWCESNDITGQVTSAVGIELDCIGD